MKKIIIIAVAVLLFAVSGVGAMLFLKEDPAAENGAAAESTKKLSKAEPLYQGLDPDFIVAFQNPKTVRFIKLSIEVMARDDDVIEAVKTHMPAIRDRVIMLLSSKDETSLLDAEGKELLRAELLKAVQAVLQENIDVPPGIEALYFTNFVMQ